MTGPDADDDELLIAKVRQALDRIERGETIDLSALCEDSPHLMPQVAEVLGLSDAIADVRPEALREDPLAGMVLQERYELQRCLGRGAMGVVYRAEDRELRRGVAVKILDARLFGDPQAEIRFQREAEALALLQHPNIVSVYDRGRSTEGMHFLVMELLDGCSLAELLERTDGGEQPVAAVAEAMQQPAADSYWPRLCAGWVRDLARGLATAHERGLVHRDIKPSNVFLAVPGRPVLLDFGIAARDDDERLTRTRASIGTPWFMPPEQFAATDDSKSAPTVDVYALGATLYNLLANRPPYTGDAPTVLMKLQHEDPTPLPSLRPELPRDLVAIVDRCLERNPARRYPDARRLAEDLDAFLEHRPVQARPLTSFGRRWRKWRRNPARPVAVASLALVAVTIVPAVWLYLQQQQREFEAARLEVFRRLPTLVAIEGWPDERAFRELRGEHAAAIAQLDRLLELDPGDLSARLFRACLFFDLDRRDEAREQLAVIANQQDSPFFRELARRYRQADPEQVGAFAIDLDGMPEPVRDTEIYVAAVHEMRNRHVEGYASRADELLARIADRYLPARDFRLLSLAATAANARGDERRRRTALLFEETFALEAIYGCDTARTQTMRGVALLLQARFEEAVAPLLRSIELRPERHSPHNNLAIAYKRLDMVEQCEHHLQEALRLRPFSRKTRYTLAQVLRNRGDYAGASEVARELAPIDARDDDWQYESLLGSIALAEAMALYGENEPAAQVAAARAAKHYERRLAIRDDSRSRQHLAIARAFTAEGGKDALVTFAREVLDAPNDAYQLANLATLIRDEQLTAREIGWLQIVIRRLASTMTEDARLRARLEREIDEGLQRIK